MRASVLTTEAPNPIRSLADRGRRGAGGRVGKKSRRILPTTGRSADGDRLRLWGWTAGVGVNWSGVSLDLAYVREAGSLSAAQRIDFDVPGEFFELRPRDRERHRSERLYLSAIVHY
jgi:hypothetical protein